MSFGSASYKYDGLGNRVQQTVSSLVTRYLLDTQPGLAVVLESAIGSDVTRFIHGPHGLERQQQPNGEWVFPVPDGLGSIRGVVDNNWPELAMLESRLYAPYGVPVGAQGTPQTVYGFTGEPTDANELVYLRARYLNPGLGVFTSLDPVEGEIRRAMSLNRYGWVEGNTPNASDPGGTTLLEMALLLSGGMCSLIRVLEEDNPCFSEEDEQRHTQIVRFLKEYERRSSSPDPLRLRVLALEPWELMLLALNGAYEGARHRYGYSKDSIRAITFVWLNRLATRYSGHETISEVLAPPGDPEGITASYGWPAEAERLGITPAWNPDPNSVREEFRIRATDPVICDVFEYVKESYYYYGIRYTEYLEWTYFKHCDSSNRLELEVCNAEKEGIKCLGQSEADNVFLANQSTCVYPEAYPKKCYQADWQTLIETEFCGIEWRVYVDEAMRQPGWPNWEPLVPFREAQEAKFPETKACGVMTQEPKEQ